MCECKYVCVYVCAYLNSDALYVPPFTSSIYTVRLLYFTEGHRLIQTRGIIASVAMTYVNDYTAYLKDYI